MGIRTAAHAVEFRSGFYGTVKTYLGFHSTGSRPLQRDVGTVVR